VIFGGGRGRDPFLGVEEEGEGMPLAGMANALLVHCSGLRYREEIGRAPSEVIADRERWERRAPEGARPFSWDASARKWEELFEGLLAAEARG